MQKITQGYAAQFPLCIGRQQLQKETPLHYHDFVELVLVDSGKGIHLLNNLRTPVQMGDVFVVSRQQQHGYSECADDFSVYNFLFNPDFLPMPQLDAALMQGYNDLFRADNTNSVYPLFRLENADFAFIVRLAEDMLQENCQRFPGYRFNMLGQFITILGKLARHYSRNKPGGKQLSNRIPEVIAYLNLHYKEKNSVPQLCRIAGMSKSALMRNFAQMVGSTPLQYQLQLQISKAALLLQTTGKNISEIAAEVGFEDGNYFSRQFKRITGITPRELSGKSKKTDL